MSLYHSFCSNHWIYVFIYMGSCCFRVKEFEFRDFFFFEKKILQDKYKFDVVEEIFHYVLLFGCGIHSKHMKSLYIILNSLISLKGSGVFTLANIHTYISNGMLSVFIYFLFFNLPLKECILCQKNAFVYPLFLVWNKFLYGHIKKISIPFLFLYKAVFLFRKSSFEKIILIMYIFQIIPLFCFYTTNFPRISQCQYKAYSNS